ncbi:MAG: ABC transporter substrate-binding protein [Chloroflexota bacterium]|nr:ABC transporter substrate-binding protein [Chloroflexota bacterium]
MFTRPTSRRTHTIWYGTLSLALTLLIALGSVGVTAQEATPAADGERPSFDLSGVQIRVTTAGETLEMPAYRIWDYIGEWGAEVDKIELTSTTGVQALLANQAELAGQGTDELILGAAEGADLVAIASTKDKMDYVMVTSNEINSVQDLAGRTIGMSGPAGFDTMLARLTVQQNGMSLDDVNFVQIGGSPDRAAALLTGRIDAAVVFIPDWFELQLRTDEIQDLLYMSEVLPGAAKSVIFGRREFIEANPELALAVACANLEAFEWFNQDKQRFIDYTIENVPGVTEEALSITWDEMIELDMYPLDPDELLNIEGVQLVADAMLENGDIQNPVDASQFVDRSYLEEAAAMGCGAPQADA